MDEKVTPAEYWAERRGINAATRKTRARSFSGDSHKRPRGFDWTTEMAFAVENNETAMMVAERLRCSEAAVRAQAKRRQVALPKHKRPVSY